MTRCASVLTVVLVVAASAAVCGCSSGSGGGSFSPAVQQEADSVFTTRCATCHGAEGRGDGPAATGLDPKPRDLQSPAWQGSVTDQHITTIILAGGPAVGKSAAMPPNPDLQGKPDVVAALVARVRALRR